MSWSHCIRAAIAIGFAVGCSNDSTGPRSASERLRVIASPTVSDTVEAEPIQAIVAEVRTATGEPDSGVIVRFEVLPVDSQSFLPSMGIRQLEAQGFGQFLAIQTDSRGLADAQVQFGIVAGTGRITISVPELGIADTLVFTVKPGAAVGVMIAPKDTVVHLATPVHFRGSAIDRFRNPRPDAVTFSSSADPAGIGSVDGSGTVAATGFGRLTVVVASGTAADTAYVTSVPPGQFAAYNNDAFVVADLDGTIIKPQFGSGYPNGFEPAWTTDGLAIVIAPYGSTQIQILHLDDQVEVLNCGVGASWPAPSPDGQFIYFTSAFGDGLWRITRDGAGTEMVLAGPNLRPSVSPDSKAVTFQTTSLDGTMVVVRVYDIPSQRFRGLDVPGHFPEWGPGSSGIAFFENNTNRIKVMAPDGTGARFLTPPDHQYFDDQLAWSPDGQWILARGAPSLELINVATGQILPLSWATGLYEPTWRPTSSASASRAARR